MYKADALKENGKLFFDCKKNKPCVSALGFKGVKLRKTVEDVIDSFFYIIIGMKNEPKLMVQLRLIVVRARGLAPLSAASRRRLKSALSASPTILLRKNGGFLCGV